MRKGFLALGAFRRPYPSAVSACACIYPRPFLLAAGTRFAGRRREGTVFFLAGGGVEGG